MIEPSKPQIIAIAACPYCAAMRGMPCRFNRSEDPEMKRTAAKQSHLERIQLARKIINEPLDIPALQL